MSFEFLSTVLSPNVFVNNSRFFFLPTSWLRFYLLITSSHFWCTYWCSRISSSKSACIVLPSSSRSLLFLLMPACPGFHSVHFVISSALFFVQMTSGSPSLNLYSHGCLEVTLVPTLYISPLLHTFYSIVPGVHVYLPNQTMCSL